MNIIQTILKDYYEIIEYCLKQRPVVVENIDKVINCGFDKSLWLFFVVDKLN